jgi:hypothetical protein
MTTHSMYDALKTFSGFYSRYYRSEDGRKSQEWLFKEILKVSTFTCIRLEEATVTWCGLAFPEVFG